ncbi:MAG: hypothetical protein V2A70_05700, partial [Candidatus Omnitrophota bacterium]
MRLTLNNKLIGGFMAVALLVLAAGGVGMIMAGVIGKAGDVVAKQMSPVQKAAMRSAFSLNMANQELVKYLQSNDKLKLSDTQEDESMQDWLMWNDMILYGTNSSDFKNSESFKNYQRQ